MTSNDSAYSAPGSEVFVPDGTAPKSALMRTTHLGIGAHPDDLEILAISGIFECFQREDHWFSGVVVTDGAGSARHGKYRGHTDERMREVRRIEQKKAAVVGDYAAQVLLNHPRQALTHDVRTVVEDLKAVLEASAPQVVFTHSLTDKHDSHVAVALRVIQACREVSSDARPVRLLGCEVWRDLDWLSDKDKVILGLGDHQHLEQALLGVYDSQIAGGKHYDTAVLGRRRAHATFSKTTAADTDGGCCYAMDLTPLLNDPHLDPALYCEKLVERFRSDIVARLERLNTT